MATFAFKKFLELLEDMPTNNAGGGAVDGIGVGPKGEPGVYRSKLTLYKRKKTPNAQPQGTRKQP